MFAQALGPIYGDGSNLLHLMMTASFSEDFLKSFSMGKMFNLTDLNDNFFSFLRYLYIHYKKYFIRAPVFDTVCTKFFKKDSPWFDVEQKSIKNAIPHARILLCNFHSISAASKEFPRKLRPREAIMLFVPSAFPNLRKNSFDIVGSS